MQTEQNAQSTADLSPLTSLQPAIIAIDGPAASGKSTVGFQLAQRTGFLFFDTGILYRAVTWAVLRAGVAPQDEAAVGRMAEQTIIDIGPAGNHNDGRQSSVMIEQQDVTWQIRTPEIDQNVSAIAANGLVRQALLAQQRRIALHYGHGRAAQPGIILVGRDIGTVVAPDAPLKIYLNATAEERARRRFHEQQARGKAVDYTRVLEDIYRRDKLDSERALAPLRPADDAIVIDTSTLSTDQVIERILAAARGKWG
ncbi:MAG: (d)CMP kinase [Caldilineaceae bacterium]